ncbi:MAG: diacylglycerol kinase family protein [Oscillospiraceae bacterium]|nr:diacylglycerol kinase family protein [Oscillospiraceae bacterium]
MKKTIGIRYALRGLWEAIRYERNMRIHITAAFYVIAYAWIGQVQRWALCAIFLCLGLVMAAELFNASIERMGDEVSKENRPLIGMAKDMGAGAVLIAAVFSVFSGALIFGQHEVMGQIAASPRSWQILLALPVFAAFVFAAGKKG